MSSFDVVITSDKNCSVEASYREHHVPFLLAKSECLGKRLCFHAELMFLITITDCGTIVRILPVTLNLCSLVGIINSPGEESDIENVTFSQCYPITSMVKISRSSPSRNA